jgi:hypothetical protein
MTPFWWALTFGGTLVASAVLVSAACLRAFAREDAEVERLRGDLLPLDDVGEDVPLTADYAAREAARIEREWRAQGGTL